LADGGAADRFLVGLAVLSLLSAAAEEQPLVCLVDDAQWLDQVSAQVLAFVARRVLAESIALVFAVRTPTSMRVLEGLPERTIGGLINGDARALLRSVSLRLDARVQERIIAETRGNPLALLELPRGLTGGELAGGFALPGTGTLAGQIEESFVRRVEALPEPTQRLLLIAAAEPVGDGALLRRAAEQFGIGPDAGAAAEDDGLIEFTAQVRFRHPLVRSAAYRRASAAERRSAHQVLAQVTDPDVDPDRRAWHLAHAAAGPDDDVAADLERSAERAQSRGGVAAAAAFLERSAKLTVDPALRASRSLAAARAKFDAAAFDAAEALVAASEVGPLDELQQGRLALLRAELVYARRRGNDAAPLLLDAAKRLEGVDDRLSRETYLEALGAAIFAGRLATRADVGEVAEAARRAPAAPSPPRPVDLLLDGLAARFTEGYAAAVPLMRSALELFRERAERGEVANMRWFWLAWTLGGELWDDAGQEDVAAFGVRLARDAGALGHLPMALACRAGIHVTAGEFTAASALIDESNSISTATGYAPLAYANGRLLAWRGREHTAREHFEWAVANATLRGEGRAIGQSGYMSAVLHNGLGRYEEALAGARTACEEDEFGVRCFALVELVEAAVRAGEPQEAAAALPDLERRTVPAGTDWALGILARSRALLADGEAAEALYLEAVERLARTRMVVHLARAHLVYGEWLRRENRRLDAREQLRVAHDMFQEMGAEAFAERARRELVATGATARERAVTTQNDLTPQEAQIARLAAAGRTNPEIGSELFISPRTVEYHLSKVFTKLGVSTRRELRSMAAQLEA
jgi:DNA-binding CsgD family transcriptional regulator